MAEDEPKHGTHAGAQSYPQADLVRPLAHGVGHYSIDTNHGEPHGQPGEDRFYGNGGEDIVDARDGVRDLSIQCGRGRPPETIRVKGKGGKIEVRSKIPLANRARAVWGRGRVDVP